MAKKIDLNGLDHFKEKENAMIASEYSSSKTYAVGDYVYHNGTLYKCTTAITTAEAWTSGHWTAAKLADDCSGLMTAITENYKVLHISSSVANITGDVGETLTFSSDSDWRSTKQIEIESGKTYKVNFQAYGSSSALAYIYYCDDNSVVLARYTIQKTTTQDVEVIVTPEDYGDATIFAVRSYKKVPVVSVKTPNTQSAAETVGELRTEIIGENLIPIRTFSETILSSVPFDAGDGVTMSRTSNAKYTNLAMPTGSLHGYLQVGKKYRLHCKAEALSGSPTLLVAVRGVDGNTSGIAVSLALNSGVASYVDFVAEEHMDNISFYLTYSTSAHGSARYSEFWVKEIVETTAVDDYARKELLPQEYIENKYRDEVVNTRKSIRKAVTEPCLVFPQITDIHCWSTYDTKYTVQIRDTMDNIRTLGKYNNFDGLLCLGDITDGGYDSSTPFHVDVGYYFIDDLFIHFNKAELPIYYSMGNHDDMRYITTGYSSAQIYQQYMSRSDRNVIQDTTMNGTNYYKDFDQIGVRLISINTNILPVGATKGAYGVDQKTITFLSSALSGMPEGYIAFLISHAPLYNALLWSTGTGIPNVSNAITAIVNSGKKVIISSGHSHFDASYYPANGVLNIVSQCVKCENRDSDTTITTKGDLTAYQYARDADSYTSDSWDVVVLKPLSNKIHYIRFGAGVDRTFNYNPVSVSDTYTFTSELTGTLTWESNDTSVATASDGVVTAVATGRAEIKATDESGNYEIFYVDVA